MPGLHQVYDPFPGKAAGGNKGSIACANRCADQQIGLDVRLEQSAQSTYLQSTTRAAAAQNAQEELNAPGKPAMPAARQRLDSQIMNLEMQLKK